MWNNHFLYHLFHCFRFSRYIGVVNVGQDLNLNQSLWHIYNALSARGGR